MTESASMASWVSTQTNSIIWNVDWLPDSRRRTPTGARPCLLTWSWVWHFGTLQLASTSLRCTMHGDLASAQWERLSTKSVRPSLQSFKMKPQDWSEQLSPGPLLGHLRNLCKTMMEDLFPTSLWKMMLLSSSLDCRSPTPDQQDNEECWPMPRRSSTIHSPEAEELCSLTTLAGDHKWH